MIQFLEGRTQVLFALALPIFLHLTDAYKSELTWNLIFIVFVSFKIDAFILETLKLIIKMRKVGLFGKGDKHWINPVQSSFSHHLL